MKQYKVYSDKLNKVFNTVEELEAAEAKTLEAENAEKQKKEARAARAKEIEAAYKKVDEAKKAADQLLEKFLKDYGAYHTSVTEVSPKSFLSVFDIFDKFLF